MGEENCQFGKRPRQIDSAMETDSSRGRSSEENCVVEEMPEGVGTDTIQAGRRLRATISW